MIVAIIQARMGSTRLPRKVMMDLSGKPVLWHVVDRVSRATKVDYIIVATTSGKEDDPIEKFCTDNNISIFRGSSDDVLKRYADTARMLIKRKIEPRLIVRITSDCPLIDPDIITEVISEMDKGDYDYVSNTLEPTYPDGLDIEVFKLSAMLDAELKAVLPSEREHVTSYIKKNPGFRRYNVKNNLNLSSMRWTLDQKEDYYFINKIYNSLYNPEIIFKLHDILELLKREPELSHINDMIIRDEGYKKSLIADAEFIRRYQMSEPRGNKLWKKAKKIIPGGNQLLSKRSEQFLPEYWPSYYKKAKGIEIWDLDNKRYIDMSILGIGACTLGYSDDDVNAAVIDAVKNGSMSTLNCQEEIELAEKMLKLHPWAEMVRFARTGGEAAVIAIRIARAFSGKDRVAFCGYHGWHDWYLAANLADDSGLDGHLLPGLSPKGVPRCLRGTALPFQYNHPEELESLFSQYPEEIGTVIMEPIRNRVPENDFLHKVRKIVEEHNAILIFDEITSGWRMNLGGIHLLYQVLPDIAIFGKAMGNGHPIAAIIGKEKVMDTAQDTFISSTYWTERVGFAAANATIEKTKRLNVPGQITSIGRYIGQEWYKLIECYDLPFKIEDGIPPLIHLVLNHPETLTIQTFITQEMLKSNYLARESVYVAYPHTKEIVDKYIQFLDPVFGKIRKELDKGDLNKYLDGPLAHSGFKRLT